MNVGGIIGEENIMVDTEMRKQCLWADEKNNLIGKLKFYWSMVF